jgi:hypothetical protein
MYHFYVGGDNEDLIFKLLVIIKHSSLSLQLAVVFAIFDIAG